MRTTSCLSSITFTRGKQHKECKKTFDYREGSKICSCCCLLLSSTANLKSYSWCSCTVLGALLLCFRFHCSGWLGKMCTSRQTTLSGFSSVRTHFQFARAEFGMQHICASFSGISCLMSCSHCICPSLSRNLKPMSVIK